MEVCYKVVRKYETGFWSCIIRANTLLCTKYELSELSHAKTKAGIMTFKTLTVARTFMSRNFPNSGESGQILKCIGFNRLPTPKLIYEPSDLSHDHQLAMGIVRRLWPAAAYRDIALWDKVPGLSGVREAPFNTRCYKTILPIKIVYKEG